MNNEILIQAEFSRDVNAITHPAPHDADDVFGTAILAILQPVILFRTDNPEIIDAATNAIIYDIGGEFDPGKKRFDHHQRSFSEARPDGTLYASAGLLWREFGEAVVEHIYNGKIDDAILARIVSRVDITLMRGIDASDNEQGGTEASIASVIASFNAIHGRGESADSCFLRACEIAGAILRREVEVAILVEQGWFFHRDGK